MQQNVFYQTKHYLQLLKAIRSDYVIKRDHSFYIISHYLGRSVRSSNALGSGTYFMQTPRSPSHILGSTGNAYKLMNLRVLRVFMRNFPQEADDSISSYFILFSHTAF